MNIVVSHKGRVTLDAKLPLRAEGAGHEFHGNQWREVSGEEAAKLSPQSARKGAVPPPIKDSDKFILARLPLDKVAPNQDGEAFDGTTKMDIARSYAAKDTEFPPIIVGQERNGVHNVFDGGHRVTAARLRGDSHIAALIKIKNPRPITMRNRTQDYALSASLASETQGILDELEGTGKLPTNIPAPLRQKMQESLERYFSTISAQKIKQFTDKAAQVVQDTLKTYEETRPVTPQRPQGTAETGLNPATGRSALTNFIEEATGDSIGDKMNMGFFQRIAREVVQGGVQHVAQNWDATRVDEFPALELTRVYEREVPRGSEKDPAGPTNAWDDDEGRWVAACAESGDEDAFNVFQETGRMVALKSSDIWESLGNGAGGYDDCLGNPFEPFAYNSGMSTDEVSRDDAEELGLLDEGEEAEPADTDFGTLFDIASDLLARFQSHAARVALHAHAALAAGAATAQRGCLMAMVTEPLAAKLRDWAAATVPDADLHPDEGRESEIHCTVKYGFDMDFDTSRLAPLLDGPLTFTLGKLTRFQCPNKGYDVLKWSVTSPQLVALNAAIEDTFQGDGATPSGYSYTPHVTAAYILPDHCANLDGDATFDGVTVTVDSLLYSLPQSQGRVTLRLDAADARIPTVGKVGSLQCTGSAPQGSLEAGGPGSGRHKGGGKADTNDYKLSNGRDYWLDPDGKLHHAEGSHHDWAVRNVQGITIPMQVGDKNTYTQMYDKGWLRVRRVGEDDGMYGRGVHVGNDIHNLKEVQIKPKQNATLIEIAHARNEKIMDENGNTIHNQPNPITSRSAPIDALLAYQRSIAPQLQAARDGASDWERCCCRFLEADAVAAGHGSYYGNCGHKLQGCRCGAAHTRIDVPVPCYECSVKKSK